MMMNLHYLFPWLLIFPPLCRLWQRVNSFRSYSIQSEVLNQLLIFRHASISASLIFSYCGFLEEQEIRCIRNFSRLELIG
jgi:hypothetical protein